MKTLSGDGVPTRVLRGGPRAPRHLRVHLVRGRHHRPQDPGQPHPGPSC